MLTFVLFKIVDVNLQLLILYFLDRSDVGLRFLEMPFQSCRLHDVVVHLFLQFSVLLPQGLHIFGPQLTIALQVLDFPLERRDLLSELKEALLELGDLPLLGQVLDLVVLRVSLGLLLNLRRRLYSILRPLLHFFHGQYAVGLIVLQHSVPSLRVSQVIFKYGVLLLVRFI